MRAGPSGRLAELMGVATRVAQEVGASVYLVGGPVRDLLLGRAETLRDIDLVVEGGAETAATFVKAMSSALAVPAVGHARFGTSAFALEGGFSVDIAMARLETYPEPAALPVVSPGSVHLDLKRRDFTINAMAMPLLDTAESARGMAEPVRDTTEPPQGLELPRDAVEAPRSLVRPLQGMTFSFYDTMSSPIGEGGWQLLDPHGGLSDLRAGRIRVLHRGSFIDDPTRIFRALRFEQRLGFTIEPETEGLLLEALRAGVIDKLSDDRLGAAVALLLSDADCVGALRRLASLGLCPALRLEAPNRHQLAALSRTAEALARCQETVAPKTVGVDARCQEKVAPDVVEEGARGREGVAGTLLSSPLPELWQLRLMVLMVGLPEEGLNVAAARMAFRGGGFERARRACLELPALRRRLGVSEPMKPSEVVEVIDPVGGEGWLLLWAFASSSIEISRLEAYLEHYRRIKSPLDGHDLMRLGLTPGPGFASLLKGLRRMALDEGWTRAEAEDYVRGLEPDARGMARGEGNRDGMSGLEPAVRGGGSER